jgi:hypothetical protein
MRTQQPPGVGDGTTGQLLRFPCWLSSSVRNEQKHSRDRLPHDDLERPTCRWWWVRPDLLEHLTRGSRSPWCRCARPSQASPDQRSCCPQGKCWWQMAPPQATEAEGQRHRVLVPDDGLYIPQLETNPTQLSLGGKDRVGVPRKYIPDPIHRGEQRVYREHGGTGSYSDGAACSRAEGRRCRCRVPVVVKGEHHGDAQADRG